MLVQAHVLQHHDGRQEQGSGVGEALAGNVGGGAVDGLEDGALVANVARGRQAETADEAGAHVGQDVAVQVGQDEHLELPAPPHVEKLRRHDIYVPAVQLDIGVLLGHLARDAQEQTVGHLHDGGLVHGADLLAANLLGVLEGEAQDTLAGRAGDELDGLNNAVNYHVLNARVFALGVFTDQNRVNAIVGGLVADDRLAGPQVCEKVKGAAESQVERDVALANGCLRLCQYLSSAASCCDIQREDP